MAQNAYTPDGYPSYGQPRKKGKSVWTVVLVLALIVLAASLVALGVIAFSYFQGQQKYEHVADVADFDPEGKTELGTLSVDWDALRAVNPDIVAWVYVPNTPINYPVVQGKDNDYYLSHDFDGDAGWLVENGTVFLDYRNDPEFRDPSSFMYGHHLNDGTMFAALGEVRDQARFEEIRTVYLLTPKGNYKLRGYSLVHCDGTEAIVRTTFESDEDMADYIKGIIERSEFDPGNIPSASAIRKSFALSTCDSTWQSSGRCVLFCYIEDKTVDDVAGEIGIATDEEGATTGFANELVGNGQEEQQAGEGGQGEG